MATKRTITDHKTGYKSEFVTEDDKLHYHTTQDVAPVIDHVKKLRDNTLKPGKDLRHIAEVPMIIWQKAVREGWSDDSAKWKQWLNNPDNKVFRTWQGKV
jgi:hypothetical protein